MISIICPFNNKNILQMLLESLKNQDYNNYELILVDTIKEGFKSAAAALNYGSSKANGDILLFVHQDVELLENNILSKIEEYCHNYEFGIAGVAGKKVEDEGCMTSVVVGKNRKPGGKFITTKVTKTQTLDECMFIIKKDKFRGFTDYGNTWHFYSVDYSLMCIENNEDVLLLPLKIYHLSPGYSMNYNYYDTLKKVAKKRNTIKVIATTCGTFKNNSFLPLKCLYYKFKLFVKRLLKIKNDKE